MAVDSTNPFSPDYLGVYGFGFPLHFFCFSFFSSPFLHHGRGGGGLGGFFLLDALDALAMGAGTAWAYCVRPCSELPF